jgi:hypothetical protein
MTKRPRPRGLSRAFGLPPQLRRLTRAEAAHRGVSYAAKHRVDASVKRVTVSTPTCTDREASDLARERRLGEKTTKKQYTRGVRAGRFRYDDATAERQRHASEGKRIRKEIPEIVPRDAAIIVKFNTEGGYEALTDVEKERFHDLFKRYPKDAVREALGSPGRRDWRRAA